MVAIAGIPGSGKTTLARKLVEGLNARAAAAAAAAAPSPSHGDSNDDGPRREGRGGIFQPEAAATAVAATTITTRPVIAIAIPMDGFHYTRAQLASMPDSAFAVLRRGAPFTFDGEAYLGLVKRLREPISESSLRSGEEKSEVEGRQQQQKQQEGRGGEEEKADSCR